MEMDESRNGMKESWIGPVDGPRIGNMRSAGMRHVGRQHQQVAGAHGVKLPGQLAPAAAFDAVDQQRLTDALRAAAQMAGGTRAIPRPDSQQAAQQELIPQRALDHQFGQQHLVLALEAAAFS